MSEKKFSLTDWLDESSLPEKDVTIYGDAATAGRIENLTREIDAEPDSRKVERMRAEREKLIAKVEGSALRVTLRALTDAAYDKVVSETPHPGEKASGPEFVAWNNARNEAMLAAMTVAPEIDAAGWRAIRAKVTANTFADVAREAGKLNDYNVADAPFWLERCERNPD